MFDRVVVDVMQVVLEILVTLNGAVPELSLPDFHGLGNWNPDAFRVCPGKIRFQGVHDLVGSALPRRLDDHVEMVGQENVRQKGKGMQYPYRAKGLAQKDHILRAAENRLAVVDHLRNENRFAGRIVTVEVHGQIIRLLITTIARDRRSRLQRDNCM